MPIERGIALPIYYGSELPLIEGLSAKIVMADTAYDADHCRQVIADKGAIAVIPNNPSRTKKYRCDKQLKPP